MKGHYAGKSHAHKDMKKEMKKTGSHLDSLDEDTVLTEKTRDSSAADQRTKRVEKS